MKLLLVMPTQYTQDGRPFKQKKAFFPTLTLPYLAGLAPEDVDVEIKNDYIQEIDPAADCDLVGISISTLHAVRGYELAEKFRQNGKTVFMGGFHATFMPGEAAQHCDSVVTGEAEYLMDEITGDFRRGALKETYTAPELHPLSGLPNPRYDLIPYDKYYYRSIPCQTSRGCPNNCRYCTVSAFYGRKYRFRPVGEVVEEVARAVRDIRSRLVMFIDDNIAAKKEYSYELFEALIPLNIRWVSQCSLTMADDSDLLRLAARAGMRGAFIGIETLNKTSLRKVNKSFNRVEDYNDKLREFRNAGIAVSANMIFGFEDDTEQTFEDTYRFIAGAKVYANPYILTPYPGTKLFRDLEENDKLLHRDWRRYTAYQQVAKHPNIPQEEMEDLFWKTYERMYAPMLNFRRMFRRTLRSFFSPMDWFLNIRIYFYNATFVSLKFIRKRLPPYY